MALAPTGKVTPWDSKNSLAPDFPTVEVPGRPATGAAEVVDEEGALEMKLGGTLYSFWMSVSVGSVRGTIATA